MLACCFGTLAQILKVALDLLQDLEDVDALGLGLGLGLGCPYNPNPK